MQSAHSTEIVYFAKDEIVWAKMRFFPPWPAKVLDDFQVKMDSYKKKKPLAPKFRVQFFDNPPTLGDVHHNQIYKFIGNYRKNGLTNSNKLRLAISQAKVYLSDEDKELIRGIEKAEMLIDSEEEGEEEMQEPIPHSPKACPDPQDALAKEIEDAKTDEREKRRAARASANDVVPSKLSGKEKSGSEGSA